MNRNGKTFSLALGAMLTALSFGVLYLSALLPSGRWAAVAVAGLMPAAAVVSVGLASGFGVYIAAGLLALMLVPDKLNVLLYLLFFGSYPMVKSLLERLRKPTLSWALKFLFFDLVFCAFVFGFGTMFMPWLAELLNKRTWLVVLAGNVIFLVYDLGFTRLIALYAVRVDRYFQKGKTN